MRRVLPASTIPSGWHPPGSDGLVAEFWSDGHLKHLAKYRNGSCAEGWALYLDEHEEAGRAELAQGSGGTADYEQYRGGQAERFDAWSDNSSPWTVDFLQWARSWIESIAAQRMGTSGPAGSKAGGKA